MNIENNYEADLEMRQKKYLRNILVKEGFLKVQKNNKGKKTELLEYTKNEVSDFLEFIISIKTSNDKEKIIYNEFKNHLKPLKNENHLFYNDLLIGNLDINIDNFLAIFLEKLKEIKSKKNLIIELLENKYQKFKYEENILRSIRKKIRMFKVINRENKHDLKEIYYKDKIELIKKYLSCSLNKLKSKTWLENLFLEKIIQITYYDVFQQLIVYDILDSRISEEERKKDYEKMSKFLDEFRSFIKNDITENSNHYKNDYDIFLDFFHFIMLRDDLLKDRYNLQICDSIKNNNYNSNIKPIEKINILRYYIFKKKEALSKEKFLKEKFSIENFTELDELKGKVNKETGEVFLKDCEDLLENFKFTKNNEAAIFYGIPKVKTNTEKVDKSLNYIIEKFPFLSKESLQVKKILFSIVDNDKNIISPFRKTLKTLIHNKKLCRSKIVENHIRVRLTKGVYIEKGVPENFERSMNLELKINEILLTIYSLKNKNMRTKYMDEFTRQFFEEIENIKDNKKVFYYEIKDINQIDNKESFLEEMKKSNIFWKKYTKEKKDFTFKIF